jgi:hypothetical protein
MPKPGAPARRRAAATPLRDMLVRRWDHQMQRWRIEGHPYPYEEFLKSGSDVVVSSGRLAAALEHAGLPADRFDDGGPDAGKPWLLGADDTLTEIRDEHVADMEQRDFDELVEGHGPQRWRVGDAYDPAAAVERHAEWTAAIEASIKQVRK